MPEPIIPAVWKPCVVCGVVDVLLPLDAPNDQEVLCFECWDNPHPRCHFCNGTNQPIHPQSVAQYGEPVCTVCFVQSYKPDP